MPTINLTADALTALGELARGTFNQTGVLRPDGTYDVPVENDVAAFLREASFPQETISDTVLRMVARFRNDSAQVSAQDSNHSRRFGRLQ